jgi:asparaginyl-tRNA synthetase
MGVSPEHPENRGSVEHTKIAALFADADIYGGREVTVAGWVRSVRDMKNFGFVMLNDGSCFKDLQVVMRREDGEAGEKALPNYDEVCAAGTGSALVVRGTLELTPDRPQPFELQATQIVVEGPCAEDYPLQKQRQPREFLRTQQHLRSRTNLFRAVFRVRSVAAFEIHRFFQEHGFVYVHTPIITGSDAEGAGEMFRVTTIDVDNPPRTEAGAVDWSQDFFGKSTNLTVSGQLQAESFALSFGDVYTFGPTFRAENSNTRRHAAEFWMVEPEMAFCDLAGEMDVAEAMLKQVIRRVCETCPDEIAFFNQFVDKGLAERLEHVANSDFARVSYTEAIEILQKAKAEGHPFEFPVEWGCDLQTEHERYLTEQHFGKPTFVTDYPTQIKAFYMRLNDDGRTVAAADCLVPGIGEIMGGSQREERLDVLERRMAELNMDVEQYRFYLDLRRYGGCHHAGFGLGFERLVMYLTGVDNIRDVIPHPRTVGNAEF